MDRDDFSVASAPLSLGLAPPTGIATARWRLALVSLAILFAALFAIYWRAAAGAVHVWYESRAYNHGFLVLPIVGYLIWERRAWLRGIEPAPFAPGLLLLIPAAIGWLLADVTGILEGQQLAMFVAMQGILLAVLGTRIYQLLRFPFLYLFFLIPTGEFLVPYLQAFTAKFMVLCLHLSGIPVFSDGIFLSVPNGDFEVAEACAGLRFLTATLAFGTLFADFAFDSARKKFAFYALCVVTPVIANGFRAYGIVLIAYLSNNQLATGIDHLVYGWIFFSIVTLALTGIGMLFRDAGEKRAPAGRSRPGEPRVIALVAVAALLLLALPRAYGAYIAGRAAPLPSEALALPPIAAPWQRLPGAPTNWQPDLVGADRTASGVFAAANDRVDLFIGYLAKQMPGKKLISDDNQLTNAPGWTSATWSNISITIAGEHIPATLTRIAMPGRKRLVISWYWVDGQFTNGAMMTKLLNAKAELIDAKPQTAAIAFSTDVTDGSGDEALRRLTDFASHLGSISAVLDPPGTP